MRIGALLSALILVFGIIVAIDALYRSHIDHTSVGTIKCDGITDDTNAIQIALEAATAVGKLRLPHGICVFSRLSVPDHVSMEGQGIGRTTLKLIANVPKHSVSAIRVGHYSRLSHFTLDGDSSRQIVGICGIRGDTVAGVEVVDLEITNILGMGDCFQNSSDILHMRVRVSWVRRPQQSDGNIGNGSGFWNASYGPYIKRGHLRYIDCSSIYNDLDGLEFGTESIEIIGGSYTHNGRFTDNTPADQQSGRHTKLLGGALGAAGIYFAAGKNSPKSAKDAIIRNVTAEYNSESGLDLILGERTYVADNRIALNGTFGILLRGSPEPGIMPARIEYNEISSNGRANNQSWIFANRDINFRAGIGLFGEHKTTVIVSSNIISEKDTNTSDSIQKWGIFAQSRHRTNEVNCFTSILFHGNEFHNTIYANFDIGSGIGPCFNYGPDP